MFGKIVLWVFAAIGVVTTLFLSYCFIQISLFG